MDYYKIVEHYENCYDNYGDNSRGVDWPNEKDANTRYRIMLELLEYDNRHQKQQKEMLSLLDFGCGLGHFLEFIINNETVYDVKYMGMDLSHMYIEHCKKKYPEYEWIETDILKDCHQGKYDYIVANGVLTEKREFSFEEFYSYFCRLISKLYEICECGVAFNVMSSHVDWARNDLFHLPMDVMASYITKNITRDFVIRNDYGLYEYTVYLYKG